MILKILFIRYLYKKSFWFNTPIKKIYYNLIEEAHFLISQNNFKDQIIHLIINNIITDDNKNLDKITDDIKTNL